MAKLFVSVSFQALTSDNMELVFRALETGQESLT